MNFTKFMNMPSGLKAEIIEEFCSVMNQMEHNMMAEIVQRHINLHRPDEERLYLESGATQCPFCGSGAIEGDSFETGSGRATQEMSCTECGRKWYDIYKINSIQPIS